MNPEIIFDPYNKITIKSYRKYENYDSFFSQISYIEKGWSTVGGFYWANGIVFRYYPFAQTDSIIKEYLKGHLPLDLIEYAPMINYVPEITMKDTTFVIANVSNHSTFSALTLWIADEL